MFKKDQDVFNILLGAVSEGVVIVDEQQKIIEANQSAETIFGYQREELINQPLNILIPQPYRANHKTHVKGFVEQNQKRQMGKGRDIFGQRKDGSIFPLEAGLNPFKIDNKTYVMALIIDITERKNYTEKLERTVELRTEELQLALNAEKELNELKTKFLSLVSHEFKTPLSGILTSAMLLSKYRLENQQEKRDKHISTITNIVHQLNTILNDFLSVEKLETGKVNYHFKTFKLSKVLNEVIYNANMLLKDGQRINYPENIDDLSIHQDEKTLELALSNIIHNAIKYSPEDTLIDITITQNDHVTIFKIEDNGIGIPEADQKNVFNRYFRAENVLNIQGTGIGLNIVKSHLENLGGTIEFTSELNKGSMFTITLPNNSKE